MLQARLKLGWTLRRMALVGLIAPVVLTGGAPLEAQEPRAARIVVRPSDMAGMPHTAIDLEQPSVERYAVIIGNGEYQAVTDLPNALNDARTMAAFLRTRDYTVVDYYDLTKRGFEAVLRRLLSDVTPGAEVVFYYAGHGLQIGDGNYLIPTDADIDSVYDVPFEAVSLSSLLSIVGARARSMVVMLDSCRNNPFPGRAAIVGLDAVPQELQTGFTPQNSPINSLIVFATSPGAMALDGKGRNSPFTEAVIDVASRRPDEPIDELMKDVRRLVYQRTEGLQVPWESSSLVEPVVLRAQSSEMMTPGTAAPAGRMSAGEPLRISTELHPRVHLGARLRGMAGGSGSTSLAVAAPPTLGRLEVEDGGRYRSFPLAGTLRSDAVQGMIYNPTVPEQPARALPGMRIADRFDVQMSDMLREVQLELEVNPCDFHAGDYLDPDGVGVARYPNEIEIEPALAACREAVANSPEVGRFHYQLGRVHMALRDLDAAEEELTKARDLGHVRAWQGLGTIRMMREAAAGGTAEVRAPDEALDLFAEGVERGDPYAFHSLGRQLLLFGETRSEERQGFQLLARALELGHTFSMNALGLYFLDEGASHYDPERGLRYLRESAERDDIYGYANLGFVYLTGAGGQEQDLEAALEWFRRAADEGHPTAPSSIGRMYNAGQVTGQPDYAEAVRWYDMGLERGDAWGGANAAWIIANRGPQGYQARDAAVRAAKAAALRNSEAAASAREVLSGLPTSALAGGIQALMAELGEDVTVDGVWGDRSEAALARVAERFGASLREDPAERIVDLARLYWQTTTFRVDLY